MVEELSTWLGQTAARAARGWLRFMAIWVPVTVLFAAWRISSGAAEAVPLRSLLWIAPVLAIVTYGGAFAFAAAAPLRARPYGYYPAWAIAGASGLLVGLVLFWGVSVVSGEDKAFIAEPWVWLGVIGAGAFTGLGYGWEARRSGLWGATEPPA